MFVSPQVHVIWIFASLCGLNMELSFNGVLPVLVALVGVLVVSKSMQSTPPAPPRGKKRGRVYASPVASKCHRKRMCMLVGRCAGISVRWRA